jgi:lysozyme
VINATGIDVSNFQGAGFDWHDYPHISFAGVKATEGTTFSDPDFARNWQQMWDVYDGRLVRIAYCFAHPAEDMAAQADMLVGHAREHGLKDGDHFAIDLETTDGLPPAEVARFGAEFSARVNKVAPGHRCLAYTFLDFAQLGNCADQGPWRLWLADYDVAVPTVPAPWKRWSFWQSGGSGLDVDQFNGDRVALLDFARMPADRR